MPTFSYRAIAADGRTVTGSLQAENQAGVLRMLDEQSLFPVKVEEGGGAVQSAIPGRKRKVKLRYQTAFYSQLADLLRAGVPLLRSLEVLGRQNRSAILTEVLREVRDDVAQGETLSDAMAKHPNAFSPLHVSMISAGEAGGFLEDSLSRIAKFAETQDELRGKLVGSMIYPTILVCVGSAIVFFLLVFIVPELRKHIKEESFNILSHIVFGATDFLRAFYPYILAVMGIMIIAFRLSLQTETGRYRFDAVKLKAPMVGRIITTVAICRFCRILGTLLQNGVPILDSLDISKKSAGNMVLAEKIENARENVQRGESLSNRLGESGLFPIDVIDMMSVAEEGNNLDQVLIQIADTNEVRTARLIDLVVRILEPILLMMMAAVVLVIALALLLPILTMSTGGMAR